MAFTDGIRRTMSSDERLRVATKAGWFSDGRNEAGIMFDATGRPILTYSLFAHGQANPDDFGATHPAVQARAVMGREFLDAVDGLGGVAATPLRAKATEAALVGRPWTADNAADAAEVLAGEATPISDHRASAAYRTAMLRTSLLKLYATNPGPRTEVPA